MSISISLEEFVEIEQRRAKDDLDRLIEVLREHFDTAPAPSVVPEIAPTPEAIPEPVVADSTSAAAAETVSAPEGQAEPGEIAADVSAGNDEPAPAAVDATVTTDAAESAPAA